MSVINSFTNNALFFTYTINFDLEFKASLYFWNFSIFLEFIIALQICLQSDKSVIHQIDCYLVRLLMLGHKDFGRSTLQ